MEAETKQSGGYLTFYADSKTLDILTTKFPSNMGRNGKKSEWIRKAIKEKDDKEKRRGSK